MTFYWPPDTIGPSIFYLKARSMFDLNEFSSSQNPFINELSIKHQESLSFIASTLREPSKRRTRLMDDEIFNLLIKDSYKAFLLQHALTTIPKTFFSISLIRSILFNPQTLIATQLFLDLPSNAQSLEMFESFMYIFNNYLVEGLREVLFAIKQLPIELVQPKRILHIANSLRAMNIATALMLCPTSIKTEQVCDFIIQHADIAYSLMTHVLHQDNVNEQTLFDLFSVHQSVMEDEENSSLLEKRMALYPQENADAFLESIFESPMIPEHKFEQPQELLNELEDNQKHQLVRTLLNEHPLHPSFLKKLILSPVFYVTVSKFKENLDFPYLNACNII